MFTSTVFPFVNPATGERFGEIAATTPEAIAQAYSDLRHAAPVWRAKSPQERVRALQAFKTYFIEAADEIAAVLNRDCGKTMQDGMVEVFITVDNLTNMIKHAPQWLARRPVPRGLYFFRRYYVEPTPIGVVAVIGPWNYPVVQVMTPVLAALAAGNTVIIKPSEVAPAVGFMFERLFAAVPEISPYVRVVHGGPAVGKAVVAAPPDLIFVTGSAPTGKAILQAAAETLTPVITELGGKDPLIVLEDADIKAAAKWAVWGAFYHSGQVCMSVERVYVVDAVYDAFLAAVLAEAKQFKIGYTTDKDAPYNCGPITYERQIDIIQEHLEDAVAQGANIELGGGRRGMFVEPTVLTHVNHKMKIMREETFGPTLPILRVRDEAEAIALANDSEYGLSACVWSRDIGRAERVAHQLEAGTLVINDAMAHYAVSQLPFGGVKKSGSGRIHGREELLQFTQSRAYAVGGAPFPLDIATIFRAPGKYHHMRALMRFAFGNWRQKLTPYAADPADLPAQTPRPASPLPRAAGIVGGAAVLSAIFWTFGRRRR